MVTHNKNLEESSRQFTQYILQLRKVQDKTMGDFIAALDSLSLQELNILNVIGDHGPCIMREIAQHAAVSLSSVTVIVDKLAKEGLVKRIRSETDRRIVQGRLTIEGQKIYAVQIQHMQGVICRMLEPLTVKEREALLTIFAKIANSLH